MKIALVIGYDWFVGRDGTIYYPNPASRVVEELNGAHVSGYTIKGLILPVSFASVRKLAKILEEVDPSIAIGLGLHPRAEKPLIEVVAVNIMHSEHGDIDGYKPFMEQISNGDLAIVAPVGDLKRLLALLKEYGFDVAPSASIGTYLCNSLAYTIYKWGHEKKRKAIFIHIPPSTELSLRIGYGNGRPIREYIELVKTIVKILG